MRDLVHLRLRLGAPPLRDGRDYLSLALDVRVNLLDALVGGAIAAAIVWITTSSPHELAEPDGSHLTLAR
jgi:hypothetical protein